MKKFLPLLAAAAVGFAVSYYYLARQQDARFQRHQAANEAKWQEEKDALEQALATARNNPPAIRTVRVPATGGTTTNRISPQETLELLIQLQPGAGEEPRTRVFRQIVHHLQTLVEAGPDSLPVIRQFLAQNKDVDYSSDALNENGERVGRSFASRHATRTDFLVPPSLRLGLVDVLEQIGNAGAEKILADMLASTGRGVEVAYVARVLQDLAPDKYREMALNAAKDLLTNLPAVDQPNRLDDNARAYLYEVFALYNDRSFLPTAQLMLVSQDGHVDRHALNFLDATLKEEAVPAVCAAYKDPRLTNQVDKGPLLTLILNYACPNAQANQIFGELIANPDTPVAVRSYTVESLVGGTKRDVPTDPKLIHSRIQLLVNTRPTVREPRLVLAIDKTMQQLQKQLLALQNPPANGQ